ncbi:MAG TPA: S8/S53 family peptidase [Kiritimatiellia bacterium]|nr:S8/S53 family peptidase [Kiritimatiellia bacterium]HMO97882.1 S8/S53 family peptidase [Kiritimatiellia bacterium]HMP95598.1 S8/S53 family peptidase [Kiritimatiellia bacterium]
MKRLITLYFMATAIFHAGCATKTYVASSGLVLVYSDATTDKQGEFIFATSIDALPGISHPAEVTRLHWHGTNLTTDLVKYSPDNFLLYARQDHFYRMHESLMIQGHRISEIMKSGPVELEPTWDVMPTNINYQAKTTLKHGLPQNELWPTFTNRPFWYMDDEYTQLRAARSNVMVSMIGQTGSIVRVGHIDTGTKSSHLGHPTNIVHPANYSKVKETSTLWDPPEPNADDVREDSNALLHVYGHGLATLSVLASPAKLNAAGQFDHQGELQGIVPFAEVVPVRARPHFMHFFPVRLARAIMHCVTNEVDVISISQGGTPSLALTAAINEAYERGTLVVAASSDFIYPYIIPSAIPFRDMAYPARYNRVLAAAGLDGSYESYGNNRWHAFPSYVIRFWKLRSNGLPLVLRGSYGPEEWMDNTLSGFAPNIPFADASSDSTFDLDGGGTSATTPQVAGAAALWLQYHMNDFADPTNRWSWEKVELMTRALKYTASVRHIRETQFREKYGHGYIKANNALTNAPATLKPHIEKKAADPYPNYEALNHVYTWIYLNSLNPMARKTIAHAFGEQPDDVARVSRYVGSYMRQVMLLREMLKPSTQQAHVKMNREIAEVIPLLSTNRADWAINPQTRGVEDIARRVSFAFNKTAGRMGAWKRERRRHDWITKIFQEKANPEDVMTAIESMVQLERNREAQAQIYFAPTISAW